MIKIAVLVLAAGKSTRMNGIKQLVKINNKTLLETVLNKAKKLNTKKTYCVLGANANLIKNEVSIKNIEYIYNNNFKNGLSSSIISGINHLIKHNLNYDAVLILLADQPAVEISYLKSMISLAEENSSKIIASNYDKKLGVPAIFPKKYYSNLLLIEADKGAKEFINHKKNEVICPIITTNFTDIDTREDLILFKKSISK